VLSVFLLGFGLLVGGALLLRGFMRADPGWLARVLRAMAVVAVVAAVATLAITGRFGILIAAATVLVPLARRVWAPRSHANRPPSPGQSSSVETAYLRMVLDHDTGAMSGEILHGEQAGASLDGLALGDLLRLLDECRLNDPPSASVLEAYLDRAHGPGWRTHDADAGTAGGTPGDGPERGRASGTGPGTAGNGAMTRAEAYEILGLVPGAGPDEIKEAHRRLMRKVHPDQGGSTYLAARINQAKDLLLHG